MTTRILVLGLEREAGPACLSQATARGFDIIAADLPEKLSELASFASAHPPVETVEMNYRDPAVAVAVAQRLHAERPFAAVYSYREFGVEAAALIAAELSLAGNPLEAVQVTRNKARLKDCLRRTGLLQPYSVLCQTPEDAVAAYRSVPLQSWILKPLSLSGSMGVQRINDEGAIAPAVAVIKTYSDREGMLLEGFVDGPEYSVEGMICGGRPCVLTVTEKLLFPGGSFVEAGHLMPAPLSDLTRRQIVKTTERAVAATGLRLGHFHVEVFVSKQGIVVGEVHSRVGGDWIDLLVEDTFGIQFYGLALEQLMGKPVEVDSLHQLHAAGVRFLRLPMGIVKSVDGVEAARHAEGVVRVDVDLTPGRRIEAVTSSASRAGSFVVRGKHVDEVRQRLDAVERLFHVDMKSDL